MLEEAESKFTEFFKMFDKDMASLGVRSYGISITTLEEVFLHINEEFGMDLEMAGQDERSSVFPDEEEEVDEPAEVRVIESEMDAFL